MALPLAGLIAGGVLALWVPVLSILSELIWLSLFMLKPGKFFVAEAAHDFSLASELVRHSDTVLAVADKWLEQKCRRMDRRMVRILGGSDKIALLVVFGLPLLHVNAVLVIGVAPFWRGAHVVLGTPQEYRGVGVIPRFWEIVKRHRTNFFSGVPTL